MQPWKHTKEPEEIKVGWRTLTRKTFERPDGVPAEYVTYGSVNDRHGAVIALTPENKIVVAEQFRPGPEIILTAAKESRMSDAIAALMAYDKLQEIKREGK